ncbi:MAG: RNA polymerase sigma-54 factor RpoN [Ktedonobacterales bacterium]|jgi:RNA polymerase sigma-54 factor|nr:MAG: RNA polymerase sigma-54 factor RpoN [Ktedonobacterales bacterium]
MYLDQAQLPTTQQAFNISPKLIASIKILQCSAEELEQTIARELSENPALEAEELTQCLTCGAPLRMGLCATCDRAAVESSDNPSRGEIFWEEPAARGIDLSAQEDNEYDPLDYVRNIGTLQDYLLRQLGAIIPNEDAPIAEYLVGNLNSHGYITTSVNDAAATLRVAACRVERTLAVLQSLDPPGIGARDLRECLLIQLHSFADDDVPELARILIEHHLHALGEHHFAEIAREAGVTVTQVKHAWRFIRVNLNPYPAHAFEAADVPDIGLSLASDRSAVIRPDVVIRKTDEGFEAEVMEERRFRFNVSPLYSALYHQSRVAGRAHAALNDQDRLHIREYSTRAKFFVDCVHQRWETLRCIANALIDYQREYLEHGVRSLRPLTRGELAGYVSLHESTVSRATANKYVLLPTGATVPFDDFFDGSLAAKDILRELIASEDPAKPYSDEELAVLLTEQGMPLARRTVAKYREAIAILPSRFRI